MNLPWTKKPVNDVAVTLNDVLSSVTAREEFLGVNRVIPPSIEQVALNINRTLAHSKTEEYKTWAQAAWQEVLGHLTTLVDPKLSTEQCHFERGALLATINLLRVAHAAQQNLLRVQKQAETNQTSRIR